MSYPRAFRGSPGTLQIRGPLGNDRGLQSPNLWASNALTEYEDCEMQRLLPGLRLPTQKKEPSPLLPGTLVVARHPIRSPFAMMPKARSQGEFFQP